MSLKPRVSEASEMSQHNGTPYLPINRAPFPAVTVDESMTSYSGKHYYNTTFWINFGDVWFPNMSKNICLPMFTGNPMTAVYAISANRPGYSDYFVLSPSSSYRSPSWMSYPPEPEDLPHQWNDTVKASSVSIYSSSSVTNSTRWLLTHLVLWPHYLHILLLSSKNQQPTFIHLDCFCCAILKVNVIFFLLKMSYRTRVTWRPSAELESFLMLSRHSNLPGYFGVLDYYPFAQPHELIVNTT